MLHIYSVLLLHLQIAKYKGFLIKIQVFTVLKDFNKIKDFKGSPRGPASTLLIEFCECFRTLEFLNPISSCLLFSIEFLYWEKH